MIQIDVGVFAYNEERSIGTVLDQLARQTLFTDDVFDARLIVLANGCRDDTAAIARRHAKGRPFEVLDLAEAGKSRTWNRFVHQATRPGADILIFCDADITLVDDGTLVSLCRMLTENPSVQATSSRPVKDIVHAPGDLTPVERMIAAAGGGLDDWRTAICGQLYAARSSAARSFHMPIGLPVEDGFARAMIATQTLSRPEDLSRIDAREDIFHVYGSERTIGALIRHQTRIVIGSAINAVLFEHLRRLPPDRSANAELAEAARTPDWLATILRRSLPSRRHGWVPFHFLTKRLTGIARRGGRPRGIKAWLLLAAGFAFDLIVFVRAQIMMARGKGAGFW